MAEMGSIGIYQNAGSNFSRILTSALDRCGFDVSLCAGEKAISVFTTECASLLPDFLDICILESGYQKSYSFPQAGTVIVPDICSMSTIDQLKPKSVITYGLSCKNTVTVSSLIDDRLVVSIQREIVSLSGNRIGEQEFLLTIESVNQVEAALASTALLLLLDVPVDTIKQLAFSHANRT